MWNIDSAKLYNVACFPAMFIELNSKSPLINILKTKHNYLNEI